MIIEEKRVDLKVGFSCNNNCLFCVQAGKRKWGDKTTLKIKNELDESRRGDTSYVVFTGGEPSIRSDIFEIVSYAKLVGYKKIQIQTNGRLFCYKDFCKKIIKSGMNEFSPSIHGHTPELHDSLTRSVGSYKQTTQGIKNIKSLGIPVLTNTVVTKHNYKHLPEIASLLVDLGVEQLQFAFVHPIGNAWKNFHDVVPKISEAKTYIHKGLQIGIDAGVKVMAEAIPYCMMQGYEEYISENYMPKTEIRDAGFVVSDYDIARREKCKKKFTKCRKCIHDGICEGPWMEYPEIYGSDEFSAVKGKVDLAR